MEINIKCICGTVQGIISEAEILYKSHFICMCDDCQSFAYYLGRADKILDRNGGTDILPVAPANLKITSGQENLKCIRLAEKGMYRWYVSCCNSPIANSLSGKMGYIGLSVNLIETNDREKFLGPPAARLLAKYGIPPLPEDAHQGTSFSLVAATLKGILRMLIKGLRKPSPFFDSVTGEPIVKPNVLKPSEREELLRQVSEKLK